MGEVRQNPVQKTVSSVYICVQFTVYNNTAQNRPDNFPSYPPDNHHCSDDVYLRERGGEWNTEALTNPNQWPLLIHRWTRGGMDVAPSSLTPVPVYWIYIIITSLRMYTLPG